MATMLLIDIQHYNILCTLYHIIVGFLDKCYKPNVRRIEGHCEPNVVFNAAPELVDAKGKNYPPLLQNLQSHDKQMFAAYLDVLPLKVRDIVQLSYCFIKIIVLSIANVHNILYQLLLVECSLCSTSNSM